MANFNAEADGTKCKISDHRALYVEKYLSLFDHWQ